MNLQTINRATGAALGLLLAGGLFAVATVAVKLALPVTAVDADRGTERTKALSDITAAEDLALSRTATLDASRGIVRLPIDTALALTAQLWQNPAAARAELNSRAEKAVAPVKKESFE